MSKSATIAMADTKLLLQLAGELAESPTDPERQIQHFIDRARSMVGAAVVTVGLIERRQPANETRMVSALTRGNLDERSWNLVAQYVSSLQVQDLMFEALRPKLHEPGCVQRREIVSDADWYGSEIYNEFRVPCGCDDAVYFFTPLECSDYTLGVGFNYPLRKPITRRAVALLTLLHSEFGWFYRYLGATWLRNLSRAEPRLSPRLRDVLELLCAGRSEKQVARLLALSQHTVHDYAKDLYRRFGVSSRCELLLRCGTSAAGLRRRVPLPDA